MVLEFHVDILVVQQQNGSTLADTIDASSKCPSVSASPAASASSLVAIFSALDKQQDSVMCESRPNNYTTI